jgi:hypothetical protein
MCFWKKSLVLAGAVVVMVGSAVMAQTQVTPYGASQYRLRFQGNTMTNSADETFSSFDYSNRLCWRVGLRAKVDDQFSAQFQIGNDWGAAENVSWNANNSPRGRALSGISLTRNAEGDVTGASLVGAHNLYVHLASFRWNPGPFFLEAGVVPLNSNGTLDLLEASLNRNAGAATRYAGAIFNGWGDVNNSMIGLKLGMPIVKEGVKVGAELFQTVIDPRTQSLSQDAPANPPSILVVLSVPVDAGDFKITPEITGVANRFYSTATEAGDHEIIVGLAGSYKVNDGISLNFRGGFGMLSNAKSKSETAALVNDNGILFGLGTTVKAGPGNIQFAVDYSSTENTEVENTNHGYVYTDLRYAYRVHPRVTVTPRYRTYSTMFPEGGANKFRMDNRFEMIIEGSF